MINNSWLQKHIKQILKKQIPQIFVETGTYRAKNIDDKIGSFKEIHSIDLNINFINRAKQRINDVSVFFHHGDSATVLEDLIYRWKEPVIFYLDAHWSGGETSFGQDECPVLRELRVLSKRDYDDIIYVDDMRLLGKHGESGIINSEEWPLINYDWRNITEQAIIDAYKTGFKLIPTGNSDCGVLIN